jgi:hypothetical protein
MVPSMFGFFSAWGHEGVEPYNGIGGSAVKEGYWERAVNMSSRYVHSTV